MIRDEDLSAIRARADRWLSPEVGARDLMNDIYRLLTEVEWLRKENLYFRTKIMGDFLVRGESVKDATERCRELYGLAGESREHFKAYWLDALPNDWSYVR